MAYKIWNSATNEPIYDRKKYDEDKDLWVRKFSFPQKQIPSAQESLRQFITKHLDIKKDKKNESLTVTIKHQLHTLQKNGLGY